MDFKNLTFWRFYFRPSFISQSWREIGRVATGWGGGGVPATRLLRGSIFGHPSVSKAGRGGGLGELANGRHGRLWFGGKTRMSPLRPDHGVRSLCTGSPSGCGWAGLGSVSYIKWKTGVRV